MYTVFHASDEKDFELKYVYCCSCLLPHTFTDLLVDKNSSVNHNSHMVCELTLRLLMSYIYGAPILDVSRSYTMTHHSR